MKKIQSNQQYIEFVKKYWEYDSKIRKFLKYVFENYNKEIKNNLLSELYNKDTHYEYGFISMHYKDRIDIGIIEKNMVNRSYINLNSKYIDLPEKEFIEKTCKEFIEPEIEKSKKGQLKMQKEIEKREMKILKDLQKKYNL